MPKSELKLKIELIPEKSWGKSLARLLPKEDWDVLRRKTYKRYNWTCLICGAYGIRVNCHEAWTWDDKRRRQILVGLICLCDDCHDIKHWGRTIQMFHEGEFTKEEITSLEEHFCKVNKCSREDMLKHTVEVGEKNSKRRRYKYKIDFSNLKSIIEETDKCLELRD